MSLRGAPTNVEGGAACGSDDELAVREIDNTVFNAIRQRRITPLYKTRMREYHCAFKLNKPLCQAVCIPNMYFIAPVAL